MQTVCLRVHQPTLYLGRLQAAACGEQNLLFPLLIPRVRAETAQAAGVDGEEHEESASGRDPSWGKRESPAVGPVNGGLQGNSLETGLC